MKNFLEKFNEIGFLVLASLILLSLLTFTYVYNMPNIKLMDTSIRSFSEGWIWLDGENNVKLDLPGWLDVDKRENLVLKNTLPDDLNPGDVVAFKSHMQSVVVRIDGETVYEVGTDKEKYTGRDFGSFWALIDTRPEHEGKEIEISLFSHRAPFYGYAPEIFTGSRTGVINHIFNQKGIWNLLPIGITFAGAVLIILSFSSMRQNGWNKSLFYLGTYVFIMGSWLLGESGILQIISRNTYYITRGSLLAILISPIAINLYIKSTVPMKRRVSANLIATLAIVNATVNLILEYLGILGITDTLIISLALISISCIYYVVVFLIETIVHKNERARKEFLAVSIFFIFIFIEIGAFFVNGQIETSYFMLIGMSIFTVLMISYQVEEFRKKAKVEEEKEFFEKMAYTDALTGAKNRARFLEDIKTIKDPEGVVIVQSDTDRLKYINDNFGHFYGDMAIKNTYKVLADNFSHIGEVYRVGGDEFSVITKNIDVYKINEIIEKIRREVALKNSDCEYDFSISLGAAMYNASVDKDIYSTAIRSDHKMYEDKKRLRGTAIKKYPVTVSK